MRKVLSFTVPTTVLSIALIFSPPALADSSPLDEGTTNDSFTFTFGDEDTSSRTAYGAFGTGACTGTFAGPRVEAGNKLTYGLHVKCGGSGFLPLSAKIRLQEEHAGFFYQNVDEMEKNLTEGGYGFVRGEVDCGYSKSGHDYRIDGKIQAGEHTGSDISKEVHLPCDV